MFAGHNVGAEQSVKYRTGHRHAFAAREEKGGEGRGEGWGSGGGGETQ